MWLAGPVNSPLSTSPGPLRAMLLGPHELGYFIGDTETARPDRPVNDDLPSRPFLLDLFSPLSQSYGARGLPYDRQDDSRR
jgi:hypothetical protein